MAIDPASASKAASQVTKAVEPTKAAMPPAAPAQDVSQFKDSLQKSDGVTLDKGANNLPDSPLSNSGFKGHKIEGQYEDASYGKRVDKSTESDKGGGMLNSILDNTYSVKNTFHANESKIMDIVNEAASSEHGTMSQAKIMELQWHMNEKTTVYGFATSLLKGVKDFVQGMLRTQ